MMQHRHLLHFYGAEGRDKDKQGAEGILYVVGKGVVKKKQTPAADDSCEPLLQK